MLEQNRNQLEDGSALVAFDPESESIQIVEVE